MSLLQSQLAQEHYDHEEGARYDDIRERYASEIEDMRHWAEAEEEHSNYMQQVYEAGFREDCDAYEANWKKTIMYCDEHWQKDKPILTNKDIEFLYVRYIQPVDKRSISEILSLVEDSAVIGDDLATWAHEHDCLGD